MRDLIKPKSFSSNFTQNPTIFSPLADIKIEHKRNVFLHDVDRTFEKTLLFDFYQDFSIPFPYTLRFFFNTSFTELPQNVQIMFSEAFVSVFNTTWNENWTTTSSSQTLTKITSKTDGSPTIGLLLSDTQIIGFIVCKQKRVEDLNVDDFPYALPTQDKMDSVLHTKYVYSKVLKSKSVLVIQEIGILPTIVNSLSSKLLSPYLCYPAIKFAHLKKTPSMLFWTSTLSQAFNWGVSIKWVPFHFYQLNDLVLMQGSTRAFVASAYKLFPDSLRQHARELRQNKNDYLCSI